MTSEMPPVNWLTFAVVSTALTKTSPPGISLMIAVSLLAPKVTVRSPVLNAAVTAGTVRSSSVSIDMRRDRIAAFRFPDAPIRSFLRDWMSFLSDEASNIKAPLGEKR